MVSSLVRKLFMNSSGIGAPVDFRSDLT